MEGPVEPAWTGWTVWTVLVFIGSWSRALEASVCSSSLSHQPDAVAIKYDFCVDIESHRQTTRIQTYKHSHTDNFGLS